MIEFVNISKTYKVDFWSKTFWALNGVCFSLKQGELVGFLGANGAGKTTSIKILMKFIRPHSGQIVYSPFLGKTFKDVISKIGYIPERPYFYPHLTGREFATYMGQLNQIPASVIKDRIKLWSERFLIDHALDRKIYGYSKGMLQRVGFVAALIHDPLLLILDEPLSGLDPVGRKEIKDVMVELYKQGKTIFFSSHIVPDVEEICDKVIVLEKGKLLYQGPITTLIEKNVRSNYDIRVQGNLEEQFLNKFPVKFHDKTNQIFHFDITKNQRDDFLREVLSLGGNLLDLHQDKPTLEEIVYKIRS